MDGYHYECINFYEGTRKPSGKVVYDYTTKYFFRSLYQRAISTIAFRLPKDWNYQYFVNVLFRNGFIAVIDTPKFGIIPQINTLSGYGLYLQPTDVLVAQPLVNFKGTIGENCQLIKLTPDYMGITDIILHYAEQMSTAYTSVQMSLENSRVSVLLGAKDKAAAATLKYIAEQISAGEPVIVYDKQLKDDDITGSSPIWSLSYDVKNNYITDKLLADMATILAAFDREIGIPTIDEKKERFISSEVDTLTADSSARISTWKKCLEESVGATNDLFAGRLEPITFTTIIDKEVQSNEIDTDRTL